MAGLCSIVDGIVESRANIHSVLVAHPGKLVFERYFTGVDEVHGYLFGHRAADVRFEAETLHNVKSVTKIFASLAVGAAIDKGFMRGIDSPTFVPNRKLKEHP